ncbi:MAG: hypothetical protein LBR07_09020 [Puniceicoccales bacterium]|jgi:opacity protein-like surface antigen|nr:hypothetical protein [Puniceicoccales bacterium]
MPSQKSRLLPQPSRKSALTALLAAAALVPATALSASVAGAAADGTDAIPSSDADYGSAPAIRRSRASSFVALGPAVSYVKFDGDNTGNLFAYGAQLSGGGYIGRTNFLLTADVGVLFGSSSDTVLDFLGPYDTSNGGTNSGASWQRERVERDNEYFAVPLIATIAYDFPVTERFSVRLGLSAGGTFVSMKNDFTGFYDIYDANDVFLDTIPADAESKDGSKFILSYGAVLGATWHPTSNFSVDLQYRFLNNSELNFGAYRDFGTSLSHTFTLSARWRF